MTAVLRIYSLVYAAIIKDAIGKVDPHLSNLANRHQTSRRKGSKEFLLQTGQATAPLANIGNCQAKVMQLVS